MSVGRGKLCESVKYETLFTPERLAGSATTTYYNGYSPTTGAVFIDTQDFDNLDVLIAFGTVLGEVATVTNAVYMATTNNPMVAIPVVGASYANGTTSADESKFIGAIMCKDNLRYMGLVTQVQTTNSIPYTVDFAAAGVLGRTSSQATTNTLAFDV